MNPNGLNGKGGGLMNEQNKDVIVLHTNTNPRMSLSSSVKLGFGFYIGWNLARTLKYTILAKAVKK